MSGIIEGQDKPEEQQATPAQRQAIYRYILRDREDVKALIRNASREQAQTLLTVLSQLSAATMPPQGPAPGA